MAAALPPAERASVSIEEDSLPWTAQDSQPVARAERPGRGRSSRGTTGDRELLVLDDVYLRLRDGEIVALLGRSGCGKSTLLRIIAGLMPATGGDVSHRWASRSTGPADGVAMVFQSFALFPWLTVLENVELGLEAQGVPPTSGASARWPPSI